MQLYSFSDIATDASTTAQTSAMITYFRPAVILVFCALAAVAGMYVVIGVAKWISNKLSGVME